MKLLSCTILLFLTNIVFSFSDGDDLCGVHNSVFQNGEVLNFKIYYSLASLYFSGGEASFTVNREQFNGKEVYHVVGSGKTNHFVDNSFKVRDRYESYIDTGTLLPYQFIRDVHEGATKIYENINFIKSANTAVTDSGVYKVPPCVHDVLSAIYSARNIDFNKYKPNDKIPFSMFLDNKVYYLYIRYLGKEIIKTRYGKYHSIKFKPLLIKGTIFTGGEKMTVWISDDMNHVPLRLESPITIGKIAVDLMSYRNLRHPLQAQIENH